jgi:predicted subunit of tRNA(5-methylaminomethyl-2-thiouridylate) methyltransferase
LRSLILLSLLALTRVALGHAPPLLAEKDVAALANELSGETAKRNLEGLARFHRQRGSQGFHAAAELVAEREALNFADGTRSARQITAALSAEYGSVPEELVIEYLQALRRAGIVD